ncbi:MAG: hypothetical protein ABL893_09310 [Hyphomicrobium sp.]|nr:hypothetical protein [Hyphomicrobium sp.]
MAYRLAVLGYSAHSLHQRKLAARNVVRDLTQGRLALQNRDVRDLAQALGLDANALMRPLSDTEFNAWAFNSASTRYRLPVWQSAQKHWTSANYSWRQTAEVLGISNGRLHQAFTPTSTRRLLYPQALALTTALTIPEGPRTFLAHVPHQWREGCSPMSREV